MLISKIELTKEEEEWLLLFFSPITFSFYEKVHEVYSFDEKLLCVLNISMSFVA